MANCKYSGYETGFLREFYLAIQISFGVCFVWFRITQLLTVCRSVGQVCFQYLVDFQIYGFYNLLVSVVINNTDEINIQGIHKRMVRFQKVTRNLFITLHGHNIQRQQRQLSKFLMRYQQFASHA